MFIFPILLIECKMQQNMVSNSYDSTVWSVMCAHAFAHYDRSNCVSKSKAQCTGLLYDAKKQQSWSLITNLATNGQNALRLRPLSLRA